MLARFLQWLKGWLSPDPDEVCPVPSCGQAKDPCKLMCKRCWGYLPHDLRWEVVRAWGGYQSPLGDLVWRNTAGRAIRYVRRILARIASGKSEEEALSDAAFARTVRDRS